MAAHASVEIDDFQKYCYFHWWEHDFCDFLNMQNNDFEI